MPATAGRVRMPANNRVHSSAALQTHGIWQCAIGYDPYAPDRKDPAAGDVGAPASACGENAYDSFQGLLQLAKIQSNPSTDEVRGACRRCNKVGHLSFQCRNLMKTTEDAGAVAEIKAGKRQRHEKVAEFDEGSDSDDESDSDSDVDSEMERAIAERDGRKGKGLSARDARRSSSSSRDVTKSKSHHRSSKKSKSRSYSDEEYSSDSGEKRKSKKSYSKKSKSRRNHSEEDDILSSDDSDGDRKHRSKKHHRHRKSSKRSRRRDATSDDSDDRRREKTRKLRKTD